MRAWPCGGFLALPAVSINQFFSSVLAISCWFSPTRAIEEYSHEAPIDDLLLLIPDVSVVPRLLISGKSTPSAFSSDRFCTGLPRRVCCGFRAKPSAPDLLRHRV
jgi:hypothetical protein